MVEQGSKQWFRMKAGKISASNMRKLTAGGTGKTRRRYLSKLAIERITGEYIHGYKNKHMDRGNELEAQARQEYQERKFVEVKQTDFVEHPDLENFGASPDGLVGDDGLIEIKTRSPHIQIDFIRGNKSISGANRKQMMAQMMCTGRKWCDYISYISIEDEARPKLPSKLNMKIVRVERDEKEIKRLTEAVKEGNRDIEKMIEEIKEEK